MKFSRLDGASVNSWAKDRKSAYKQINARAETVDTLPAFREAFKELNAAAFRSTGSIEWTGPNESSSYLIHCRMAASCSLPACTNPAAFPQLRERTFTIITTTPNSLIALIHNRMPVILTEEQAQEWTFLGNKAGTTPETAAGATPDQRLAESHLT